MPLGVIRFRKLHASWVNTVGTNGRSLLTHPMSAVAQEDGTSGYMSSARNAHAQVACSNSPFTDSQSIPSMLWNAMPTAKRTPRSMPMFSRLRRLILRRDVVDACRGRQLASQRLQRLALVLDALG